MIVIGHRGAKGLAPENTISSFQKAQELDVDMIEMDLRQSRDGRIMVSHDEDPTGIYSGAIELPQALANIRVPVNLEIKEPGFEEKVLEAVKDFPFEVLISSFKPKVVKKIRTLNREIKLGSIIDPDWKHYFKYLMILGRILKIYSIHPHVSLVTKKRVWWMHKLGFNVFPWVINSTEEFETMKKFNVDGVITDRPDIIRK